jgi:hypothetical protein
MRGVESRGAAMRFLDERIIEVLMAIGVALTMAVFTLGIFS